MQLYRLHSTCGVKKMYIEPSTNIRILKNVPLDNTYQHTLWFSGSAEQANYFISLQKYNLTGYTHQRVQKGVARVGINAENLYDCNYLMFQNAGFGTKWFYAFITSVEYVNNECSEISFEIDVMQTWFFNYDLEYCYVEREHSTSDNIGDNIIPENVECGEYVYNDYGELIEAVDTHTMSIIVAVVDTKEKKVDGKIYDKVYGGATLYAFNSSDTASINALIESYISSPDSVVGLYIAPECIVPGVGEDHIIPSGTTAFNIAVTKEQINKGASLNGYVPKNAKMYTYPFNFYSVDNGLGDSLITRYEYCGDGVSGNLTPIYIVESCLTQPVTMVLRPRRYKGVTEPLNESLKISGYPLCSWNSDSFAAWVAQNTIPTTIKTAGSAISNLLSGNVPGAIGSLLGATTETLSNGYTAAISADISKGNLQCGNVNVAHDKQTFFGGRASVSYDYAKSIDDFFTMYGYATHKCKIPNRTARPHWNYVKTIGCNVRGSVPADDLKKICTIYDAGVTFWKNGTEVGNYSLDNSI